ncbi:protein-disulfide reductase DsbD family protein [Candidatus Laterigemmans baculatus]|uniref:protein-disulfide reductase DsbD family protein n=1 Tax=Candidatus Laterigemmans baculatus TaxID=2770505 RepID=UPI0013DC3FB1|nr:thioredoxin family protein [Candidatus Laterigemmans baculatus]
MTSLGLLRTALACLAAIGLLGFAAPGSVQGQFETPGGFEAGKFDFGSLDAPAANEAKITFAVSYELAAESQRGRVRVAAELSPKWHVYSTTQPAGGPTPTKLELTGPEGVRLLGPFVPSEPPAKSLSDVWPGLTIEEHADQVVWTAPIEIVEGADRENLEIGIRAKGLTCQSDGSCIPFDEKLIATYAGTYEAAKPTGLFREEGSVVHWQGMIVPAVAAAGETVELQLTAAPDEGFHVYKIALDDASNATNLVLTQLSGLAAKAPLASAEPVEKEGVAGAPSVSYYEGAVTWTIPITIPNNAAAGEYPIEGFVGYQACTDTSCRQPEGLKFSGHVRVGEGLSDEAEPLAFASARYPDVLDAAATTDWVDSPTKDPRTAAAVEATSRYPLSAILGMALIGGLILNLMPCVLPVVGLKLMALIDQAGEEHSKVLSHNLWYSFGLLSVFWLLAGLAVAFRVYAGQQFSWGQQFTYFEFRLALALLVFVMALSFLGVWEIPLPGFASGKASQQLQKKEGPAGAFFKGVFTTVLATPCSGPLLGVVFGFTLAAPPWITVLVFTTVGLGMALPYILIGISPQLVFWLPKPGAWMETLKQLMAFVLLGTVAFLFAGFSDEHKLPVFVTLIGAWFACWLIGRVPQWDSLQRRATAWSGGLASAVLVGLLAFRMLVPGDEVLPWEPYSEPRLAQLQREGKTVMVDFTAKWCVNCIVNYNVAINTEETAELMRELDAVPLLADWTDHNEEIRAKLSELESNAIPVLAIYPAGRPGEPIVLRDLVSQEQVLDALRSAGASEPPEQLAERPSSATR